MVLVCTAGRPVTGGQPIPAGGSSDDRNLDQTDEAEARSVQSAHGHERQGQVTRRSSGQELG